MSACNRECEAVIDPVCRRCGDRFLRRCRAVGDPIHIGCWRCWMCDQPEPGAFVDVLARIRDSVRTLLCVPSEAVTDETFARDLAQHGAAIAPKSEPADVPVPDV